MWAETAHSPHTKKLLFCLYVPPCPEKLPKGENGLRKQRCCSHQMAKIEAKTLRNHFNSCLLHTQFVWQVNSEELTSLASMSDGYFDFYTLANI